jgi:uncharacterized membrane protein YdbT with pleckstrin-like domain
MLLVKDYAKAGTQALVYRLFKALVLLLAIFFLFLFFSLALTQSIVLSILIAVSLSVPAVFLPTYLEYIHLGYKLDSNSVNLRKGMFSVSTTSIPFAKITNVTLDQSFIQRLFSVGNITIDQEDSENYWGEVDLETANKILKTIASKSNIQPVASST